VLSQLGHQCAWGGVLADEYDAPVVLDDLEKYHINTDYCTRLASGKLPTSYITLNRSNGSRTIVHFRDIPEYSGSAFARIPLHTFDWIHFEGRNIPETQSMMQRVRRESPQLPVSLEIEKLREGMDQLFPLAHLLLVSSDYMRQCGCEPDEQLQVLRRQAPDADIVLMLGKEGAIGLTRQGKYYHQQAFSPHKVVDTLAAGDTFNAGVIDGLCRHHDLKHAMRFASRLAGNKCGQSGLHRLEIPAYAATENGND
jgi:ketohexokinase